MGAFLALAWGIVAMLALIVMSTAKSTDRYVTYDTKREEEKNEQKRISR